MSQREFYVEFQRGILVFNTVGVEQGRLSVGRLEQEACFAIILHNASKVRMQIVPRMKLTQVYSMRMLKLRRQMDRPLRGLGKTRERLQQLMCRILRAIFQVPEGAAL
jgi:hypothetical protein